MKHVLVLSTSVPHNTLTEKMIGNLLDRVGLPAATSPQDWLAQTGSQIPLPDGADPGSPHCGRLVMR